MASTISAGTTAGTALNMTGDTTGNLAFQTGAGANTITVPNGTGTIAVQGVSTNIVSGTAVASTSGTSIDFTSIPSWVKRVSVIFNGVGTSGTSAYLIQIGSGSVTTSGYSSGGNRAGTASPVTATSTAGFIINSAASGGGKNGIFTIALMNTSNGYVFNGTGYAPAEPNQYVSAGNISLSGVLDRVRITTVNGTDTFDAGSINILYE
jgi:hypothetical protein